MELTLPATHPLRNARIWKSGVLVSLRTRLRGGNIDLETSMQATGLPPHIILARELTELKGEIREMKSSLGHEVRGIPNSLKTLLDDSFDLGPSPALTRAEAREMNDALLIRVQESIANAIQQNNTSVQLNLQQQQLQQNQQNAANGVAVDERQVHLVHNWGNRLRLVPESFKFPA